MKEKGKTRIVMLEKETTMTEESQERKERLRCRKGKGRKQPCKFASCGFCGGGGIAIPDAG